MTAASLDLVKSLLALGAASEDTSADEMLTDAIGRHGWPSLRQGLLLVLEEDNQELWNLAVECIWGAALDNRELDADHTIALVYHRLGQDACDHDQNLAWSIASKLKEVGYLSEYDPLLDPGVCSHLERLQGT